MPRDGSGIYTLPQIDFVPGSIISSSKVNSDLDDLAADLNVARPIVAGGTGATTAAAARTALGSGTVGDAVFLTTTKPAAQAAIGVREVLTAARTYYVRTDGSDSNTGLVNSSGGAFLTVQKAWNTIITLDLSGNTVTIQIGDGTYTDTLQATVAPVGGPVIINGNSGTPANVSYAVANGSAAFNITCPAKVTLQNFKIANSIAYGVNSRFGATVYIGTGMIFGACNEHVRCDNGGYVGNSGSFSLAGNAGSGFHALRGGVIELTVATITQTGTPAFSTAYANADNGGIINTFSLTFSGAATGPRYTATVNGMINTGGGGASYFPGSSAGSTATGGQYA